MIISCTPLLSNFNDYDFSDFTNLTPYTLPITTLQILPLKCSSYFLDHRHYPRQQRIIERLCIICPKRIFQRRLGIYRIDWPMAISSSLHWELFEPDGIRSYIRNIKIRASSVILIQILSLDASIGFVTAGHSTMPSSLIFSTTHDYHICIRFPCSFSPCKKWIGTMKKNVM